MECYEILGDLTDRERKFINRQIDRFKYKYGLDGITAFITSVRIAKASRDFERMMVSPYEAMIKFGNAISGVIDG